MYVNLWLYGLCHRTCISAYSPESVLATFPSSFVANYLPNLPTTIRTTADLYNLPLFTATGFAGNLIVPGRYHQDSERRDLRPRLYFQDTWKIRPNLTFNYGLAWEAETGNFNSDLPNPKLVAPILFVDGHSQQCDFTAIMKKNLRRGLEPGKDWMWYKPRK